jgi:hypothetical protein
VLIVFSVYTTVGATVEQSSTKTGWVLPDCSHKTTTAWASVPGLRAVEAWRGDVVKTENNNVALYNMKQWYVIIS